MTQSKYLNLITIVFQGLEKWRIENIHNQCQKTLLSTQQKFNHLYCRKNNSNKRYKVDV
jgi:hypothetical protein